MGEKGTLVDLTDDIVEEAITAIDAEAVPSDWQLVRLGNVVMVKGGKRLPKGADFADEPTPYPYIRIVDFVYGSVDTRGLKYLTPDVQREISRYIIGKEDVYISIAGTTGIVGTIPPQLDGANLTENAAKLVINDQQQLDKNFLALLLGSKSGQTQIRYLTTKTSQPKLALVRIEQIRIPLPPIPEQRAIAHALRTVQAARETRRREAALERERKAALMQRLFTQGTRGEPTKTTEIGEVPVSWQICTLGEIAQIAYGLTVNETRRKSLRLAPYLAVANVTRGALRLEGVKQIGMLDGDEENYRLRQGDVLLVEGNGNPRLLGSAAVWRDELPFALHQNHLIRARPNQKLALPEWIMSYLNSDAGRTQLLGRAKTSSGLHSINSRLIASLQIPLPTLAEQRTIAEALHACDEKIAALEREAAAHDELFKALLEQLMTGRLRVGLAE
jgi:type I restriction enzyme S subunit